MNNYKLLKFLKNFFFKIKHVSDLEKIKYVKSIDSNYPLVKSIENTLDELIHSNKSISRFGDGEFLICLGNGISFQKYEPSLRKRLLDILNLKYNNHCIIAIIDLHVQDKMTDYTRDFLFENLFLINRLVDKNYIYSNARITRELNLCQFKKIKKLWNNSDVIFVTGKNSRFNTNHQLFDNIKTREVVFSSSRNAWSEYDLLKIDIILKSKGKLFPLVIASLGPTATVLAFDLSKMGIKVLDLGHITNIYDRLVYSAPIPEKLTE